MNLIMSTINTQPISQCYDNFLEKACPVGTSNDQSLGWLAWAMIIGAILIPIIFVWAYVSARRRENRIIAAGGDPMIHIGNMSIRPSDAKMMAIMGYASHAIRNHKPITARPDWQDKADQETRDMWGRGPQP